LTDVARIEVCLCIIQVLVNLMELVTIDLADLNALIPPLQ